MPRRRTRSRILKKFPDPPGGNRARKGRRSQRHRSVVRRRGARRTEEQDHPALGQAGNAALGPERPAHRLDLHLRRDLPERRQGGRPDPAQVQHRGDAVASGRNRKGHRARTSRRPHARQGRMAYVPSARRARKSHAPAAPSQVSRTQSGRERLGVHARQLALEPHLPELRRHRRSLLRRLEQAQKSTLARHVHRSTRLGAQVLISENWYEACVPPISEPLASAVRISLRVPSARPNLSPGYFLVIGDAPISQDDGLIRLYWHLKPGGAARWLQSATAALNARKLPFHLKVLHSPQLFTRCDAGVLYLPRSAFGAAQPALKDIYAHVETELRSEAPALTKSLAPGLGLAESPAGESF